MFTFENDALLAAPIVSHRRLVLVHHAALQAVRGRRHHRRHRRRHGNRATPLDREQPVSFMLRNEPFHCSVNSAFIRRLIFNVINVINFNYPEEEYLLAIKSVADWTVKQLNRSVWLVGQLETTTLKSIDLIKFN